MKKSLLTTAITFLLLQNISAQTAILAADSMNDTGATKEKNISGSFEMNYLRHYIWRGSEFGNNDVAQPELVLTHNNFSLALCANLNYIPKNVPKEYYSRNAFFDEQDIEIRYANKWGKFDCEFKAMAYFYFSQINSPNTAELYSWTGYPIWKELSFFTENSIDIINYRGAVYSNNGLYLEHSFRNNLNIEWSSYVGFANKKFNSVYFESEKSGMNLVGTNLAVSKDIKNFYIKAAGEINHYTSNNIKIVTGLNGTNNFILAAGVNF
jgi:hypothetical protein